MSLFSRKIRMSFLDTQTGKTIEPDGDNLNIGFTVERTLDKEPSTLEATIHNLSAETRESIKASPNLRVILEAGYEHAPNYFHSIFVGDVRQVRHRWDAPALATDIEAGDGEKGARNWARRWFRKGTTVDSVFRYLAGQAGYGEGNIGRVRSIRESNGLPDRLENGIYVRGYAADELYELARSRGIEFSVQDNEVQLLPYGQGKEGVPVTEISEETGLIGYPTLDVVPVPKASPTSGPSVRKSKTVMTLNCRLNPNIFPGSVVDVKSKFVTGRYRVLRGVYSGSLYGDDFNLEIEGEPVPS